MVYGPQPRSIQPLRYANTIKLRALVPGELTAAGRVAGTLGRAGATYKLPRFCQEVANFGLSV